MAKRKVPVEGVILVTFPPPMPEFSDLLDECMDLLDATDGSEAADPDEDDGPWSIELRVKADAQFESAAGKLARFLQKKKVSRKARMEVGRQYGPVTLWAAKSGRGRIDPAALIPEGEPELEARLFVTTDSRVLDFGKFEEGISAAVAGVGNVTEATHYANGAVRFAVAFPEARAGAPRVAAVLDLLRAEKMPRDMEVSLVMETPLRQIPIYPPKS
jgi:hypothetical protein